MSHNLGCQTRLNICKILTYLERFLKGRAGVTEVRGVSSNINIQMIKMKLRYMSSDIKMEQSVNGASFCCYSFFHTFCLIWTAVFSFPLTPMYLVSFLSSSNTAPIIPYPTPPQDIPWILLLSMYHKIDIKKLSLYVYIKHKPKKDNYKNCWSGKCSKVPMFSFTN